MPGSYPSLSGWVVVPFKANAERRHHIPKQRHRATNSAAYDAALRQRGSLAVCHVAGPDRAVAAATGRPAGRMRVAGAGSSPPAGTGWIKRPVLRARAGIGATASCTLSGVQIDPDTLPSDAAVLQQMLRTVLHQQGALHAENDKLRLLIQRLMRHQFGRRSEQLSPDQLQFGLEELEQAIAANQAAQETATATAGLPPASRQAVRPQPRCVTRPLAALRGGGRRRGWRLPLLRSRPASDRRVAHRATRHRPGAAAGPGHPAAALRVPRLRGRRAGGAGARPPGDGGIPPLAFHLLRRRNLGQFRRQRRWSRTWWSANMRMPCRSTARRRCWSVKASSWIARPWRTGWVALAGG